MQARLQTETTNQHQGEKSMRIQNQSHVIVLNTAVNLLREHYPGLTSEQLHATLSHSEIQGSVQKKLTRRECAELLYQLSTLCQQDILQEFYHAE